MARRPPGPVPDTAGAPPIQPVENPILCSPYVEPTAHWVYQQDGSAQKMTGRREASYWYRTNKLGSEQEKFAFAAEEQRDDLPLVNSLRKDIKRWRESGYRGATEVTKQLLRHWSRPDRARRLFFCQVEAVETIIFLEELYRPGPTPSGGYPFRFKPEATAEALSVLLDQPADVAARALRRLGCKMATGSGKTLVMSMLTAWALCNRAKRPADERFPGAVLAICPNLTVRERLQVILPEHSENYYDRFELVPPVLRSLLTPGRVKVMNWHKLALEGEHVEGGKSYPIVNKGEESPEAFAKRVLGDLVDHGPILVLNDEAHHAYRPKPTSETLDRDTKAELQEATIWVEGLDRLNAGCGIRLCADLSATPFYIQGSGHAEGTPFAWLVSDFGLVDAIESGIVKIPRLPVSDATGRPEPKYYRLWHNITEKLQPADRLPGRAGKPKPDVIWRDAQDAVNNLASQWKERFERVQGASAGHERIPPVWIVVCDNTDIAQLFYEKISGETVVEVVDDAGVDDPEDDVEAAAEPTKGKKKAKTKVAYGTGSIFPELLSNTPERRYTLRIDSKLLDQAESDGETSKDDAAQQLRRIVDTVGRRGEPGEHIRCVVSVQMLSEGWDANNVTNILGLRAFGSQLLCEQVVGRGLRRMSYDPDPETGLLNAEYVDVYGIPFSVVPFKGRPVDKPAPEDEPRFFVHALEERADYEIRFPIVENFVFALRHNLIRADVAAMEGLKLETDKDPTGTFVKPAVGYKVGLPSHQGPGEAVLQTRASYYASVHLQTIKFEIARQVVSLLVGDSTSPQAGGRGARFRLASRHQLFPQVFRLIDAYVTRKVQWNGCDPRELGHEKYVQRLVERLVAAIEPDTAEGELPLLPILNRFKPRGSTAEVAFKTLRKCHPTERSHIDQVVLDTQTWEAAAAFHLEASPHVAFYARNDHLGFAIRYEYLGVDHHYEPDFLVRLVDGRTLIVEVKGYEDNQALAKHQAAKRWVSAVNNWGEMGQWAFHVCRLPQMLGNELAAIAGGAAMATAGVVAPFTLVSPT